MNAFTRSVAWFRSLGLALIALVAVFRASAFETDNFYLPLAPEFADLGNFLETLHTLAIEAGVERVNSRIERALQLKDPTARAAALQACHSPDTLAAAVADQFGDAPFEKSRIEHMLNSAWAQDTFPQQTVHYENITMNLRGHVLLDPRALLMLWQCSTVRAYGVYLGTDKLVHFHQLGRQYYQHYRALLRDGYSSEEAQRAVIQHFAKGTVLAEGRMFGTLFTGIYSNADMAANFLGFKFLLNLTEPVSLAGRVQAPLVVRCGVFWRVNEHVRPHSGWFHVFVSDHLNEALNPSLYDASMRPHVRRILRARAAHIVEFYTNHDHRPLDAAYFERLAFDLATYHGEPYGHSGHFDKLMHLGNTCIPALQQAGSSTSADFSVETTPEGGSNLN